MHRLLARQLERHLDAEVDPCKLERLLGAVSDAYEAADTDRLLLERSLELASRELYERNQQLEEDLKHRRRLEIELRQGEKLRAVGQLAAGIAHEINTPVQFVGDNLHFLEHGFAELSRLLDDYAALRTAIEKRTDASAELETIRATETDIDLELLRQDGKSAFERINEGLGRVTEIVRAMKEFGHTDRREVVAFDLNRCLLNTLTVARNEVKYVADVDVELGELPPVRCNPNEIGQVFLNLIINAAHAVADCLGHGRERGKITIRSGVDREHVFVTIADDGSGMPPDVAQRVFEPFFTTKEIGRGTGQGLPIARSIVVDKHQGSLTFTTAVGEGTTFEIRLPIKGSRPVSRPVHAIGSARGD